MYMCLYIIYAPCCRQLRGENLGGASMQEILAIEQNLLDSLMRVKKHKVFFYSIMNIIVV